MRNPLLQNSNYRVLRGGCWYCRAKSLRVSHRSRFRAPLYGDDQSFRLFRTSEES